MLVYDNGFRHAYIERSLIRRYPFEPSGFFSMIVSLFHGSTGSNPHVKEIVFISQNLLQPSIITSGLWLIQEKMKSMFRKPLQPCFFKGAYLFHRSSCNDICSRSTVLNAQQHLQRSHSFMVNQHSEITFSFSTVLIYSAESKGY